jgi:hypothetical protein
LVIFLPPAFLPPPPRGPAMTGYGSLDPINKKSYLKSCSTSSRKHNLFYSSRLNSYLLAQMYFFKTQRRGSSSLSF